MTGLAARGLGMALSMVSVPLSLAILDRERYGLWVTVSSLLGWLAIADLGMGASLTTPMTDAIARDEVGAQRRLLATTFYSLVTISAALAFIFFSAYAFVPWRVLLGASPEISDGEVAQVVLLAGAFFFVNFPLGIADRMLAALQETYVSNMVGVASNLATVCALALVAWLEGGVLGLLLANGATALMARVALWWYLARRRPLLLPRVSDFSWARARGTVRTGLAFLLIQLLGIAIWQTDNVVVSLLFGSGAVTDYAVTFRLGTTLTGLVAIVSGPLWPAYADAIARGDLFWLRTAFRRVFRISLLFAVVSAAGVGLWGVWFVQLWTRGAVQPDPWLVRAVALHIPIYVTCQAFAIALNSMGRVSGQLVVAAIAAVVNLVLSVLLGRALGLVGVCLATSISAVPPAALLAWQVRVELVRRSKAV